MKRMIKRILEYMEQYEMVKPGDRVIAAVSGGADSVCLLSALGQIAPELPVSLSVLHVKPWSAGTGGRPGRGVCAGTV